MNLAGRRYVVFVFAVMIITASRSLAQINLVTNPSFELYDTCPTSVDQINFATGWFQPNTLGSSTDYFNACSSSSFVSSPTNITGYQVAHSGQAYAAAGIVVQVTWNYGREYLEGSLLQPLDSNKRYCFSMYTSLSNTSELSTEIGIKFTSDSLLYSGPSYQTLGVVPEIVISDIIALEDTIGWVLSSKVYNSIGGEQYITLGNFWNQQWLLYDCFGPNCGFAYFLFDDISVVLLPDLDAGSADTICANDSIVLNGTISETWPGMSFEWLPHAGLSDPYSLNTLAFPQLTTTYTLTVSCPTCDVPCLDEVKDSVRISVVPQLATVFQRDTLCSGETIMLNGTISESWNGLQYEWLPHTGLSDPFILNPVASPSITTTYTLSASCQSCTDTCFNTDTTLIVVNPDCTADGLIHIPTLIQQDEKWVVLNLPENTVAKSYDMRGRLVFESFDYHNDWFVFQAKGTYVYELILPSGETYKGKLVVQ